MNGSWVAYKELLTSYYDEYVCLDNTRYIVRKFIVSIEIVLVTDI